MAPSLPPADAPAIEARHLSRVHHLDGHELHSVDDVSLSVDAGEIVALVGPSGSGKTSLLHLLGGLDTPNSGTVLVRGTDWRNLDAEESARFRRRSCAFVVQGESLLPQATAAENIEVPLLLDDLPADERRERTFEALRRVGLEDEGGKLPDQLSGGQRQRIAVARAVAVRSTVLLADEPTGSLDSQNAAQVVDLILALARSLDMAVVLVTHDPSLAGRADRTLQLHSGRLRTDGHTESV